jgi:DNA-binding NtrC family response regulator
MARTDLTGRTILVLEDEPLIALEIEQSLKAIGARVITTRQLSDSLKLADDPDLAAAVVDYKIGDGDSAKLCWLLKERGIPFLFYSGYDFVSRQWPDVPVIPKPTIGGKLATAVASLVSSTASSRQDAIMQASGSAVR